MFFCDLEKNDSRELNFVLLSFNRLLSTVFLIPKLIFCGNVPETSLINSSLIPATKTPTTEPYWLIIGPPLLPGWLGAVCEKFVN